MTGFFNAISVSSWRRNLFLILFSLCAFLPGIGSLPPVDRDEARFVQATRQMMESGDYVDIRFQDQHRYKKPAGIYWLQTAAVKLTGQGADAGVWAYRLVSVAAGLVSVAAIASLGAFLFGPLAGLAAGLMLAGIFGLGFEARLAKTDAALLACTLVSQAALARFYILGREGKQAGSRWWWAFWLANGAGILIKGPITPLVGLLTIAAVAIFDKSRGWLRGLKPLPGLAVLAVMALPWFIAISMKTGGAFWAESVGKDMLGKVAAGAESHGAPPGYYVLTYSLYMWPFALIALDGGLRALERFREPKFLFPFAWYVPFWLALEATPTKLPHYLLPAYPALLLLGAWALTADGGAAQAFKGWRLWLSRLALIGLLIMTVGFAALAAGGLPYMTGTVSWVGLLAACLALVAGWLASGIKTPFTPLVRIGCASAAAVAFMALFTASVVPAVKPMWLSPAIASAFKAQKPCADSLLAAVDYHEPSLVFLAGTATKLTDLKGAAAHLTASPACGVALVPSADMPGLAALLPAGANLVQLGSPVEGISYSNGTQKSLVLLRLKH